VRTDRLAGAVLMLGLAACGTPSHGWSRTDDRRENCSYAGKQVNLFMVMHFCSGGCQHLAASDAVRPRVAGIQDDHEPA